MFSEEKSEGEPLPEKKPVELKHRTITLTNRAPIDIVEDEWPVVADGTDGYEHPGGADLESWRMNIRVRRETKVFDELEYGHRYIIHAGYEYYMDNRLDLCQKVRVGRVLNHPDTANDVWNAILGVGEELRSRIEIESLRAKVTGIVDRCFAKLKPISNW
jgi:hypothetical protein